MQNAAHPDDLEDDPALEARIVSAIGEELAAILFLHLGGSPVYVPNDPKGKGRLEELIGRDAVLSIAKEIGMGHVRLPLGTQFLVVHLFGKGMPIVEIARRVRRTDTTIRNILSRTKSPVKGSSKPLGAVSVTKRMAGATRSAKRADGPETRSRASTNRTGR